MEALLFEPYGQSQGRNCYPHHTDEDSEAQSRGWGGGEGEKEGAVACCVYTAKPRLSGYTWRQAEWPAACSLKYEPGMWLNGGPVGTGLVLRKGVSWCAVASMQ